MALSYYIDEMDMFEESCFYEDEFCDQESYMKERKTIKDVMTVTMAMKCGKSSKNHKLYIRRHQGNCGQQKDSSRKAEERNLSKIVRRR